MGTTLDGFASWLIARSERPLSTEQAQALASISLGGLISSRLKGALALADTIDDELLIGTWVDLLAPALAAGGTAG